MASSISIRQFSRHPLTPMHMNFEHILDMFRNREMIIGILGSAMVASFKWIGEVATPMIAIVGACVGIVMAIYGIREKRKSIDKYNLEIKKLKHDIEKMEKEDQLGI